MGAREKLNQAYASGSLVIAAILGLAFQSGWAFIIAATILLVMNMCAGEIRPRRR
jgi:hypothetical protein